MVPLVFILHLLVPHSGTTHSNDVLDETGQSTIKRSNSVPNLQHPAYDDTLLAADGHTSHFVRSDQVRVQSLVDTESDLVSSHISTMLSGSDTADLTPATLHPHSRSEAASISACITKRQTGPADDMLIPTASSSSRNSSNHSSPRNKKSANKKKNAHSLRVRFAAADDQMDEQQHQASNYQSTHSLYESPTDDDAGSTSYSNTSFQRTTSVPYKENNTLYDTYNNTLNHSDYEHEDSDIITDIMTLLTEPVYLMIVLGLSSLTFVIGAMSFWAPAEYAKLLGLSANQVTTAIGIITLVTGIVGTW